MQQRLFINLCLLLAVSILTVFFFLSDKQQAVNQNVLLSNIDVTNISQITIQRADKEDILFQKQDGSWFMITSVRTRANISRINAMLHLPGSRSFAQIDVQDSALAPYQLNPATIVLRLDAHEFFFGATDPLDERRYVMFNDTIHLINDSLYHQLRQGSMFFVSTRLIPTSESIISIQFSHHLMTKANQLWSLSPVNDGINSEQLDILAEAWGKGQAQLVRQYRAVNGSERVSVEFRSGRKAQFDVLSRAPELVLGRADLGLQYHLDEVMSERLFLPLE